MENWQEFLNVNTAIAVLFLAVLVYLVGRALVQPVKYLLKLAAMVLWGAFLVLLMNIAGQFFLTSVPFNPFTVMLAGYFGLPWSLVLLAVTHVLR